MNIQKKRRPKKGDRVILFDRNQTPVVDVFVSDGRRKIIFPELTAGKSYEITDVGFDGVIYPLKRAFILSSGAQVTFPVGSLSLELS